MGQERHQGDIPLGYVFAVGQHPYCCWGFDHDDRTLEFLDGLDTGFFKAIATVLAEQLESGDPHAASVALRVSYHQGLETLFSLLAASAQAPAAVPAWIASCRTDDLRQVVGFLRDGKAILTQAGRARVSFLEISRFVHRCAWPSETGDGSTATDFARFWQRLSREFLDETSRSEYNALKHGSRVLPGGFTLAIGNEGTPGVAAPADALRPLGGSEFGATFFATERVGASKHHVGTRRMSVNWSPLALAQRLVLVSMSISNVVGGLRCALGADPSDVQFTRPDPRTAFEAVWERDPSVTSTGIDRLVQIDPSDELSKDELLEILEQRGTSNRDFEERYPN